MGEFIDKAKGKANEAVGDLKQQSTNPATRADGERQETVGKAQQVKGEIKGALGDKI